MVTEFVVPTTASDISSITAGPDGNLWFTEFDTNKIGRITPAGVFTEFVVPGNAGRTNYIATARRQPLVHRSV